MTSPIHFDKQVLTDFSDIYIPSEMQRAENIKSNITKIEDKYYYYKYVSIENILNEFIGSYLCKKIELDSVDYQLGIHKGMFYALSEIFYQEEYHYHYAQGYNPLSYIQTEKIATIKKQDTFEKFIETLPLDVIDSSQLQDSILKLIAIDLKMGQIDRHDKNIMLMTNRKEHNTTLAPIYDFESSYVCFPNEEEIIYDNPYILLRKNQKSLMALQKKFPKISQYAEILQSIDIEQVLTEISEEKDFDFLSDHINYYKEKDKVYNKSLRYLC